jgi:hypothetical protein
MFRSLIFICLLTMISFSADANLNLNKNIPGGDDPKKDGEQIFNQVFTVESALEDIKSISAALDSFIQLTDISRSTMTADKLRKIGNTDSDTQSNFFWNWIGAVEGTLHKQEYQINKLNYDLAQKRYKLGEIKNDELQKAKKKFEEGEKKFQKFWDSYSVFD